jgi:VCBS repeat-containing protein
MDMKKSIRNRQNENNASQSQRAEARRAQARRRNTLRKSMTLERLENREVFAGDAPVAINDMFLATEDQPLVVGAAGVLANDTDAELDSLTAELFSGPANGSVSLLSDGSFQYTPNPGFSGIDAFLYRASDGVSLSLLGAVTLRVADAPEAPISSADAYTIDEDGVLTVDAASGVLANDTDADGDMLSASLVAPPANGTVTLNADGSFSYTPNANFTGVDTFTYVANDGGLDGEATSVTIEVAPVADAPISAADAYSVDEDGVLTVDAASGVLANDTDADGDMLSASLVAPPANGTVTLNADGSFSYTSNANFTGVDTFTYVANDGGLDGEVTSVTIEVAPVADAPISAADAYSVDEDGVLTVDALGGVLVNDTDADGDMLSASLVAPPANGTVTLNADGSFSYTPNANFTGVDTFTYVANDGGLDGEVTSVTIEVAPVVDAPISAADAYSVDEDGVLTVDALGGVLVNDTDADGDMLSASLVAPPANGTVTLNADGSFSYTPNANFTGVDTFTYVANDGGLDGEVTSVTIEVAPVADAPISAADAYSVDEDGMLTVDALGGVLVNDTDADGEMLSASLAAPPANGTVTLNSDGSFSYTPNANFTGVDTFTYVANDGGLDGEVTSVTIEVAPIADAPVSAADAYSIDEDGVLTVDALGGVLVNDTDADGEMLSASLAAPPANGTVTLNSDGSFSYTPNANFTGVDTFTYVANDGGLDGEVTSVTIEVAPVADAPVANNDVYTVAEDSVLDVAASGVLSNDTDADGDSLAAILVTPPIHGVVTFNADGSFVYSPEADFVGVDGFSYYVNDGSTDSDAASVTIEVTAVQDAPIANNDVYTVAEDSILEVAANGVLGNDVDADGDSLAATLVTSPIHGVVTFNADGSFVYTPDADFVGIDGFSYYVNDGSTDSDAASVTIEVTAVNDAPVAQNDVYSVDEDSVLEIAASGVLSNDSDVDGDSLEATLVTPPLHGELTLNADGSFTYTPDPDFAGVDSFSYLAGDGTLASDVASVTIEVNDLVDIAATRGDSYNVGEDNVLIVGADRGLLANDVDPQGLTLTALLDTPPEHGEVVVESDGSFRYQPDANYVGTDWFTYTADNGSGASVSTVVTIVVQTINDAPTAMPDEYQLGSDGTLSLAADAGVLVNDVDIEGDALTPTLVEGPAHGTVVLGPDGSFLYSAKDGYRGADSFRYQVNDGMSDGNVVTVTLLAGVINDGGLVDVGGEGETGGDSGDVDGSTDVDPVGDDPLVIDDSDPFAGDEYGCGVDLNSLVQDDRDWGHHGRRDHHGRRHHVSFDWFFEDLDRLF